MITGASSKSGQLTQGRCCDLVIEATGEQQPLDLAAELTRERGRLVIANITRAGLARSTCNCGTGADRGHQRSRT